MFLDEHDLMRLDVAVDDAFVVGGVQGGADLAGDVDHLGERQSTHPTQSLV